MACPSRGLLSVASVGQVMALCLHPVIINQAFRHKYVDLALEFIAAQPDVWLTTSDDSRRALPNRGDAGDDLDGGGAGCIDCRPSPAARATPPMTIGTTLVTVAVIRGPPDGVLCCGSRTGAGPLGDNRRRWPRRMAGLDVSVSGTWSAVKPVQLRQGRAAVAPR